MAGGMLQFPGQVHYAATAAEVEAVAQQVRAALPCPATIGIDFEWWFLGCEKGPIATVQLCWEEGGELHAAVLQVARLAPWEQAAERMTPSLRELLQDANVRKVTFGKFDQPRFRATYGWGVAGMIDVQPCLGAVFGALLEDMYAFPRLAEAAVWVLGHDVDKQHQTSNGWEEPGQLSESEIEYAATDAYAHLMLWRATLCYDALQRPLAAQPEAQAAVPAPAAQRAENAAVAKAAQGAAAEEPAGGRKRARPQGASSSGDSLQRSKRLAPDTESQEHEPPPAPASQPSSQEDARSGSGSQGGEAGGGREADSGGSQGSAGAPTDLQVWGLQILTRRRFCGSWSRGEPWEQVEAARQAEREQWVAEVKADRAQETDEQVEAALSFVQAPLALPLAEPEGAEALAARLLAATASARQ